MRLFDKVNIDNINALIDLHIHLDGALSFSSCRQLAALEGISIPSDDESLKEILQVSDNCHDLNEFLEKFAFPCSLLQTKESISWAVFNLQEELLRQGLIYAEIRFAPQLSTSKGLSQRDVIDAACEGLKRSNFAANLILCCMRGADNSKNEETVRLAAEYLGRGVCAIDLAGAEMLYPTADYVELFALAKKLSIPFTIHAGEADGSSSVAEAISFGAKRIGHGVRSAEDPVLVSEIAKEGITLEMCPTSNLCTAVISDIADWPLKTFLQAGVPVTINTDDPIVCATTLRDELRKVIEAFKLEKSDVKKLQLNAVDASFADLPTKNDLREKINKAFA